ncbi:MAG TPA: hypothetical protein VG963_07045, partial [Polyangiaceae bacterium]|nr:hypothetical protein [Polyangiaceae bacterium]
PFSERHAIGVARAAFALLAGQNTASQLAAYRTAIAYVRPGSPEAEVVADTLAHVERGWLDPDSAAALAASADQESAQPGATRAVESPALDETVIEPAPRSATVPPSSAPARTTVHQPGTVSEPSH